MRLCGGKRKLIGTTLQRYVGHDEVCFEGNDCPVCGAKEEIDQYQQEIEELREKIKELERE